MKRFLIAIICLFGTAFGLLSAFYVGGVYLPVNEARPIAVDVRTKERQIELQTADGWKTLEIRGVNMGSGIPGKWSTDYAIDKKTYLRWFEQIRALGANVIRVYSIQNRSFYEALDEFNLAQEQPLYLLQGIWVDGYVQNSHMDAYDAAFRERLLADVKLTVDVLHGNRFILTNDASKSTGLYLRDVSQWVLGYMVGSEWTDVTVAYTDEKYPTMDGYEGVYLYTAAEATPFESLLAEVGDSLIAYETARYRQQRLVTFANGRMTDPFTYPEDVREFFRKCAAIDAEHICASEAFQAGMFASYSVYAYDLDYLSLMEPAQWQTLVDAEVDFSACDGSSGEKNTYAAYLKLLYAHHTIPVVVAEFGAATGRGLVQSNVENSSYEGHLSEQAQGAALIRCYEDIRASGCAGACVYSWQDEWYKRTWNTMYAVDISRNIYWSDAQSNDQHFGLLAFDAGSTQTACTVDGDVSEWRAEDVVANYADGSSISVRYDEAYVYLRIYKPDMVFGEQPLYVPIDTTQKTGARTCPAYGLSFDKAVDFLLVIDGTDNSVLLAQDRYHAIHANYEAEVTGQDAYIDPPAPDSTDFEPIEMVTKDIAQQFLDNRTSLQTFVTGKLHYGDANPAHEAYDSLADFMADGENIEVRLPWHLLNFSDPSRMQIHDDYYDGNYGVKFLDISELSIGLGTSDAQIQLGTMPLKGWGNAVTAHERLKPAYYELQAFWMGGEDS